MNKGYDIKNVDNGTEDIIVSIIVPTYNRANLIHRAINSIKKQSFKQWECIIVDDRSTDNTIETVNNLIREDRRFSIISNNRQKGAPGARNTGILSAHGEYVVLFDSDNVMHPNFLEEVYNAVKRDNVDVCGCHSIIIDEETGNRIGEFRWEGYGDVHIGLLKAKCYFDNSSTLIKRQKLLDIGLLDEICPSYQEWDTHICLSKISKYTTIKKELIDYYRGGADTISKSNERAALGQMYILNKFKDEFRSRALYTYVTHNLLVWSWIKETSNEESYKRLLSLFVKDKSTIFLFILRVLYYVRLAKKTLVK